MLFDLYTALGEQIHVGGVTDMSLTMRKALANVGLLAELAAAADIMEYDTLLRESHHRGMDPVGDDVGTPVIHIPGPGVEPIAVIRPLVSPAPKGEAAGRLWDGLLAVAGTPGFFELKRSRDVEPIFDCWALRTLKWCSPSIPPLSASFPWCANPSNTSAVS